MRIAAFMFFFLVAITGCDEHSSPSPSITISLKDIYQDITPVVRLSYFAKTIPFAPIERIRKQIENIDNVHLKSRGEAHITVIDPDEYSAIKQFISMDEINRRGTDRIRAAKFDIDCVGRGEVMLKGNSEKTYFVVVNSEALLEFRREIESEAKKNGFKGNEFNAENYYPHITIGFTKRDLFLEDGVKKNHASCHIDLQKS